jgi:hypothetical protein
MRVFVGREDPSPREGLFWARGRRATRRSRPCAAGGTAPPGSVLRSLAFVCTAISRHTVAAGYICRCVVLATYALLLTAGGGV